MTRMSGVALLAVAAGLVALGRAEAKSVTSRGTGELPLLATYPLSVAEPSDLTINETGTTLWTVTNHPARVYQLDSEGKTVKTLDFVGEDLEGIAYDRSDHTLWVAEENRREIIHLDLDGGVLSRHALDLVGEKNCGIEGLCLDGQGRMFALNEKRPGLFIELGGDKSIMARRELMFAKDYSGMAADRKHDGFWIVSDKSQELILWSPRAGVLKEYRLPFAKAEGVAVDHAAKRIYIVSDSEQKLYVYRLRD